MLSSIRKDKNRRRLVKKFEIKRLQAKVFSQDLSLKQKLLSLGFSSEQNKTGNVLESKQLDAFLSQKAEKTIPQNSSKNRVQNRCIETGRSRAVLRFCKLSRIVLREKASKGIIPGISKASW